MRRMIVVIYAFTIWPLILLYEACTAPAFNGLLASMKIALSAQAVEFLVFMNTFLAVWLFTSMFPSLMLRARYGLQFCLVFIVTCLATVFRQVFSTYLVGLNGIVQNPFVAGLYLVAPYATLIIVDHNNRKAQAKNYEPEYVTEPC